MNVYTTDFFKMEDDKTQWQTRYDYYWYAKFLAVVGELGASLANEDEETCNSKLNAIVIVALNWLAKRKYERNFDKGCWTLRQLFKLQDALPIESGITCASGLDLGVKITLDYIKSLEDKIKELEEKSDST